MQLSVAVTLFAVSCIVCAHLCLLSTHLCALFIARAHVAVTIPVNHYALAYQLKLAVDGWVRRSPLAVILRWPPMLPLSQPLSS